MLLMLVYGAKWGVYDVHVSCWPSLFCFFGFFVLQSVAPAEAGFALLTGWCAKSYPA
jgi:hypothetical protein